MRPGGCSGIGVTDGSRGFWILDLGFSIDDWRLTTGLRRQSIIANRSGSHHGERLFLPWAFHPHKPTTNSKSEFVVATAASGASRWGLCYWRVLAVALVLAGMACRLAALEPVAAKHGMVVSSEPHASAAGVQILREGGNAVDAAVATGFALAVTYPFAGNIGGGGFMLIRMTGGAAAVVDYREEAPAAASRNMYLNAKGEVISGASTVGGLSVGVPGTVAGLALAEQKYGRLGLARVMAPAIRLARNGFPVSYWLSEDLRAHQSLLSRFPDSRRIFLRDGNLYHPGEMLKQPELARTLGEIARAGAGAFYEGNIARDIVQTEKKWDGIITLADLDQYQAKIREPLTGHFRGYTVLSVPPPSSGGTVLIEMLNILEPLDLGQPDSYDSMHLIVEAMRRAFADRAAYMGDTDFVRVPIRGMINRDYAATLREGILRSKPDAPVAAGRPAEHESSDTTHFSVVDAQGNAVSNTYTLNNGYGSGITVEGAGFLLNDEMDDFTSKPGSPNMFGLIQSEANAIAPRKRPLSAMTPTIVLKNNSVRLVLGSPGGPTIINTVLEVMLNALVYKMDILHAVIEPRFHNQWMPDSVALERQGFSADTIKTLQRAGYQLSFRPSIGQCEAIEVDAKNGWRFGASDPRGHGEAAGY
jgi:gamma-glutamyltranspeptidase / glutathione hydrolase